METLKNIGVIAHDATAEIFRLNGISIRNGYNIKKVWMKSGTGELVRTNYPLSEIVNSKQSILNDHTIDLVILASPLANDLDLVSEMLAAGKQVRVI